MIGHDIFVLFCAGAIILLSIPCIRFAVRRPMLQGLAKWFFYITALPLFMVGMAFNFYLVDSQLKFLVKFLAKIDKSPILIFFSVPLAVLLCFIWYAMLRWVAEFTGIGKPKAPGPFVDIALTSGTANDGMPARLVIIHKELLGALYPRHIILNGAPVAQLYYRQFVTLEVSGGRHTVGLRSFKGWPKRWHVKEFELDLQGGRTYFYQIKEVLPTKSKGTETLEQIDADKGERATGKLKSVPSGTPTEQVN